MPTRVLLVALAVTFVAAYDDSKIVGGSDAAEGEYPHQVQLKIRGHFVCGGSILDETTILTAAHCHINLEPSDLTVTVGTNHVNHGGDVYNITYVKPHERYCWRTMRNDIAIVKLQKRIVFSKKVQPVLLETKNVEAGREAVVSGWGVLDNNATVASNNLQHIKLRIISFEECKKYHFCPSVKNNEICTLNKVNEGTCRGDSGGALLLDGRQIGIVSWGVHCAKGRPDVYVKVSAYISWIYRNI